MPGNGLLRFLLSGLVAFEIMAPRVALSAAATSSAPPAPLTRVYAMIIPAADLHVVDGPGGSRLRLKGGVTAGDSLAEAWPAIPITLELPPGMAPRSARVRVDAAERLPEEMQRVVRSTRRARPLSSGAAVRLAPRVELGPLGYRRGDAVVSLLVTPFQESAADFAIELASHLQLELDLVPDTAPGGGEERFVPLRRSTSRIVGGTPFLPAIRPSLDGSAVVGVIITDAAQAPVYQQLADWKTATGVPTVVRTLDWIRANYPRGVDTPETIRNFIRDAAQKWGSEWFLIGGDTPIIPIRYVHSLYFTVEDIPTDLYYQCLDGTWNADGDAYFGEAYVSPANPGDACDLYSDVRLGRLPTNSAVEAQTVVDKILAYTRNPVRNGYLTRLLALGEVLFPDNYHAGDSILLDGGTICETAIARLDSTWSATRLYEHCPAPEFPACILEQKATVIDSLNAGFGIVHHVGHGFTNTMSVGVQGLTLSNADADALSNAARTFLLYAINCTSSAVDYSCIAERFVLNPSGGAVASIGSTRYDYPFTSWNFQDAFYTALFAMPGTELGRVIDQSREVFIPSSTFDTGQRWTQFSQLLLGDPGMPIWTREPEDLSVSIPGSVTLGASAPVVTVLHAGLPVEGARVCFQKLDDDYAVALTDAAGVAAVPFAPDSTGPFVVHVTAPNAVPWSGGGVVIAGPAPHLFVSGSVITDDGTLGSTGNGNGLADAGETLALRLTLTNRGGATPDSVDLALSVFGPGLQMLDPQSRYAPFDSGATHDPLDPILLRVAPGVADRAEYQLTAAMSTDTFAFADQIRLTIRAPLFDWYRQWARDSVGTGNDDGVFAPGEPIALRASIRNLGLGNSDSLVARLGTTDTTIVLIDSVMVFGDLPGGSGAPVKPEDGFVFALTDTNGVAVGLKRLTVSLYDRNGGGTPRAVFTVAPPALLPTPVGLVATGAPGSVVLAFTPIAGARLRGYNIYRGTTPAGPFSRINPFVTEGIAWYRDEGLTPFQLFSYTVAAQDSFGNEGAHSAVASASTTLPARAGFPLVTRAAANGSVTLANLDADPEIEILGAGEEVYAANPDGTEITDGDGDPATIGALTSSGGKGFWNAPAVGDVDGDGAPEVAAISWTGAAWLWSATGQARPGWPRNVNLLNLTNPNPLGSVAMADLDGDRDLELVFFVGANIFAFHHTGAEFLDGDANPSTIGLFKSTSTGYSYGTPALADLNHDGRPELICAMRDGRVHVFEATTSTVELPGFPVVTGGNITSSPAVGDLDGDGSPDIVVGSSDGNMYALRANGTSLPGWPQGIALQQDLDSSPALGDLDGDGRLDVVCGSSNGRLFAWRDNGALLPGFPVIIRDALGAVVPLRASACLADLDSDNRPEILIADQIGRLHAFRYNGTPLPGFPVVTQNKIDGAAAVWDLDGDGLTEIVVQSFDQRVYVWDTPWTFNRQATPWPMFHHDERHTGNLAAPLGVVAAAPEGESITPAGATAFDRAAPNPFRATTTLAFTVASRIGGASAVQPVRIELYNAAGQPVRVLLDGALVPGSYSTTWDGRRGDGRRAAAGVYLARLTTPAGSRTQKLVLLSR